MEVMLDTDVLIDVMKGRRTLPLDNTYSISVITLYEVMRGSRDPLLTKRVLELNLRVYPLDNTVLLKAAELYRSLKERGELIGEADLLIAATAIANRIPLLTRNIKHFEKLAPYGLKLFRR